MVLDWYLNAHMFKVNLIYVQYKCLMIMKHSGRKTPNNSQPKINFCYLYHQY